MCWCRLKISRACDEIPDMLCTNCLLFACFGMIILVLAQIQI